MAKSRKKIKPIDYAPFKLKREDYWYIQHNIFALKDYREDRYDQTSKIRARLFYKNDDLPENVWCLPIPIGVDGLFSWNAQLILQTHSQRVGIIEMFDLNDNDDDSDHEDDRFGCIFEDYNDMLLFKLSVKI